MLAIRMQRTGRKGHANFRLVVQDSRQTPTSGKFVALLGSYDPHTKIAALEKEKAEFYLKNGAQPSERVAKLLKSEGVKLPSWVSEPAIKKKAIRNPEKLRKNRPAGAPEPQPKTEEPVAETESPKADSENIVPEKKEEAAAKAPSEKETPEEQKDEKESLEEEKTAGKPEEPEQA